MRDEKGQAVLSSLVLLTLAMLFAMGSVTILASRMQAVAITGRSQRALDMASGTLERMIAALQNNEYDATGVAGIHEVATDDSWTTDGSAENQIDGTVRVVATAEVHGARKRLETVLRPTGSSFVSPVMVSAGDITHAGEGPSHGFRLYGNVYANETNLHPQDFGAPQWSAHENISPEDIASISSQVFEDAAGALTNVQVLGSTYIKSNTVWNKNTHVTGELSIQNKNRLTIASGYWCVVDGDLLHAGEVIINGTMYVRGSVSVGSVSGRGMLVCLGDIVTRVNTARSWYGLRAIGFGDVVLDLPSGSYKNGGLFVYSEGDLVIQPNMNMTLNPGGLISFGDMAVVFGDSNARLNIYPGQFTFNGLQISLEGAASGHRVISRSESDSY